MRHVILGVGAAGITAAKTIRVLHPDDEIIMISADEQVHSRCMLHKVISGERDEKGICFVPEDFFSANQITWYNRTSAKKILPSEKKIVIADGSEICFDKLLIATGADSFIPPVGALREANNVYGLRHLSDALAIRESAKEAKHILIIGSGLVGLDAAFGLLEQDKQVSVVEMANQILPIQLDEVAAKVYQERFENAGCRFYLGRRGSDTVMNSDGKVTQLILDNGERLDCDLVVVAVGVRPALELLLDSGFAVDRDIAVNGAMQLNYPDIYAAGDVTGLSGIWPNAMKQGKIAAQNMCGGHYQYVDRFAQKNTINFFGLVSLGLGKLKPNSTDQVEIEECQDSYKRAILKDGKLVGILLQGDISHAGIYQYLIKQEVDLSVLHHSVFRLSFRDFYATKDNGEYDYI